MMDVKDQIDVLYFIVLRSTAGNLKAFHSASPSHVQTYLGKGSISSAPIDAPWI